MAVQLDDDRPRPRPGIHQVGQDLSNLSVEELAERIEELKAEIARLEAARHAKSAQLQAAAGFFKR
jgi:uncharacterized small protein (DUF1192 family)